MGKRTGRERAAMRHVGRALGEALGIRAVDGRNWLRRQLAVIAEEQLASLPEPRGRLLPLKHVRMEQLRDAGFTVPDFCYFLRGTLDLSKLREFCTKHSSVSLRNYKDDDHELDRSPMLPLLYEQSSRDIIESFCREYNTQHHTLVNQGLHLPNSLFAGNIVLLGNGGVTAFYFEGNGTPRNVNDGKRAVTLRIFSQEHARSMPDGTPEPIKDAAERLQNFMPDFRPMTVEFSIYPHPSVPGAHIVYYWEWRGGSHYDYRDALARLLPRLGACPGRPLSYDVKLRFTEESAALGG